MKIEVQFDTSKLVEEIVEALRQKPLQARLLSVEDCAMYLNRTPDAVRKMIARGVIPQVRLDERVMIDRGDLDRYILANRRVGNE